MFQPAFTVVTTWASNAEEFREKCLRMLESYGWKLIVVERANPVPDDGEFSKEVEDMLERTRSNPNAINLIQLYNRWGCEIESCSHDLCAVEHKEESDG